MSDETDFDNVRGCDHLGAGRFAVAESPPANGDAAGIHVGQPLDEALAVLKKRGMEASGGFALHIPDKDDAHLAFRLDEKQTSAAIFYSRSKRQITGISVVFSPRGQSGKIYQSWRSAKSVRWEGDGTYVVHFYPEKLFHCSTRPTASSSVVNNAPSLRRGRD